MPMDKERPRTKERIVGDHFRVWEKMSKEIKRARRPVIAISREAGSLGQAVAKRLAEELKMELYAKAMIEALAEEAKVNEWVVRMVDERARGFLDDLAATAEGKGGLVSEKYYKALVKIMGAIDLKGNAVVLGRGAVFLLRPDLCLRVRIIAPLEARVACIAKEYNISPEAARHQVETVDGQRKAFVRHYFGVNNEEPGLFDVVINNEHFDVEGVVDLVKAALRSKRTLQWVGD